jgi:nucleoside-triphosphatase
MSLSARHLLLTGPPGCGKTTVLLRAVGLLRNAGAALFGFTTPEIRDARTRTGFALELLSGEREVLASVDFPGPARVGRYGVRVDVLDRLAVPEVARGIAAARDGAEVVIAMDEIGKMELFSQSFRQAVLAAFDSPARVLATIMERPHSFADALKGRAEAEVIVVTPANRERLPERIAERMRDQSA